MPQILVPTSTVATGSWTTTPLWSKINDNSTVQPTGDDVKITSADNTNGDNADFKITSGTDPVSETGHILRARWHKSGAGGHTVNAVLELWEGVPGTGTLRATLSVAGIGETEIGSTYTLSAAEANSISNYTNLHLRLSRQGDTGGQPATRRSLVADLIELEIPDAPAAPADTMMAALVGLL